MKTIVLNAQRIKCEDHNNELQCIISEQKPDIIAITETLLKPDIPNSDIPDYFSVYRKDRPGGEWGGGVLIAGNNKLLSSVCTELDTECEILCFIDLPQPSIILMNFRDQLKNQEQKLHNLFVW